MLLDFFYTLRAAKLPVSVKEFLTLLEALQKGVVGPNVPEPEDDDQEVTGYKIDDFYYLARTALVKDEKHYDKFDRAFAAYFKGVELLTDFTKEVPLEWLRKNGAAGIIKEEVSLRFGKGENKEAERLKSVLKKAGFKEFDVEIGVHVQTLWAWAREALRAGKSLPVSTLGIYLDHKAVITPPKEAKAKP